MAADVLTIPRDPDAPKRTRYFIDVVASLLNPLIQNGTIVQQGPSQWAIAGRLFFGHGKPAESIGAAGDAYIDLNNGNFFWKT